MDCLIAIHVHVLTGRLVARVFLLHACMMMDILNPTYEEEFQEYASPYASDQSSFVQPGWFNKPLIRHMKTVVFFFIPFVIFFSNKQEVFNFGDGLFE